MGRKPNLRSNSRTLEPTCKRIHSNQKRVAYVTRRQTAASRNQQSVKAVGKKQSQQQKSAKLNNREEKVLKKQASANPKSKRVKDRKREVKRNADVIRSTTAAKKKLRNITKRRRPPRQDFGSAAGEQMELLSLRKRLSTAVKHGDIKSVKKYLKVKSEYNFNPQLAYDEALVEASQYGHKRTVHLLLDTGADARWANSRHCTALHAAVENGYADIVKTLLVWGADINSKHKNGDTPLMLAVEKGHSIQTVCHLLNAGALVNCQNRYGRTPVFTCVEKQDFDMLRVLVESGGDLNVKDSEGKTALTVAGDCSVAEVVQLLSQCKGVSQHLPLFSAIEKNSHELVGILLDCDFVEINAVENSRSALVSALLRGSQDGKEWNTEQMINQEIVKLLVKRGAKVNQPAFPFLPLCLAAASGRRELVRLFITFGANVDTEDMSKMTPLMYAAKHGYPDIIKELVLNHVNVNFVNQMDYTALSYALAEGRLHCVTVLLQNDAVINKMRDPLITIKRQQDESLRLILTHINICDIPTSHLFVAIQESNFNAAKCLIEHGMDVNVKQFTGETALMEATTIKMIDILIEGGADVNLSDRENITPLMHLSSKNCPRHIDEDTREAIVLGLLINGADPNKSDCMGATALMKAVCSHRKWTVHSLLDAGADVNKTNSSGHTALMLAAQREEAVSIVKLLVENGAYVNVQADKCGTTALMFASMNSVFDAVQILLSNGADVHAEDMKGNTALLFTTDENIAALLCSSGAKINKTNSDGKTALMYAANGRKLGLLKLLINLGADACAVDHTSSASSLTLIVESGSLNDIDYTCIETLIEAGAATICCQHCNFCLAKLIINNKKKLVRAYVTKGAGPSTVCIQCLNYYKCFSPEFCERLRDFSKLSALDIALICGNMDVARYLKDNLYLVQSDIFKSSWNRANVMNLLNTLGRVESLAFLNNFYTYPKSLHDLSFVVVSDLIGPFFCRKDRVKYCRLPFITEERLKFAGEREIVSSQNDLILKQNVQGLVDRPQEEFVNIM